MGRTIIAAILLTVVCCPPCNRDWRKKRNPDPWDVEWQYVCVPTGRSDDAQVTISRGEIKVWSRGADYGEFQTVEQAKTQAEKVVVMRKLNCPE
jgi:hypothetical protein